MKRTVLSLSLIHILIRTEEDSGSLLLIDSRYGHARTRALLAGTLIGDALGL